MNQNPFSLYDFLGYLIPGLLFVTVLKYYSATTNSITLVDEVLIFFHDIQRDTRYINIQNIESNLIAIVASYTIGHLINFVSSITIERYSNWMYGYPSKFLLGYEKEGYFLRLKSEVFEHPVFCKGESISKMINCIGLLEKNSSEKDEEKLLREKSQFFFKFVVNNLARLFLLILLLPISILDFIFGKMFGFRHMYLKCLDEFMVVLIKNKIFALYERLFISEKLSEENYKKHDFHRLVSHYVFDNSSHHQFRMVNYVALYGFLRNLALISVINFWLCFYGLLSQELAQSGMKYIFTLMVFISIISFVSFLAYMKFYRRYTLEGLMLIATELPNSK